MDSANKMQRIAISEKLDGIDQSGLEGDADGERAANRANAADGKVAIGNWKSLRKRISSARTSGSFRIRPIVQASVDPPGRGGLAISASHSSPDA